MTKRRRIIIGVAAALVAGGLAVGLGLMSGSNATAINPKPAAHTTTPAPPTTAPPTTTPPTTVVTPPPVMVPPVTTEPTTVLPPPTMVPPPLPATAPPVAIPPAVVNGIAQQNGGDHDPDNDGGPSDGDGNL